MSIKHLVILFVAVGTLFSCKKDETDSDTLIASWQSVSETEKVTYDNVVEERTRQHTDVKDQIRITFGNDGGGYIENYSRFDEKWERDDFTYKVEGNELIVQDDTDSTTFTFSLGGGNLLLSQKFTYEDGTEERLVTFKRL